MRAEKHYYIYIVASRSRTLYIGALQVGRNLDFLNTLIVAPASPLVIDATGSCTLTRTLTFSQL
jgi:hypothetical protein